MPLGMPLSSRVRYVYHLLAGKILPLKRHTTFLESRLTAGFSAEERSRSYSNGTNPTKRVAILGAGVSGMTVTKSCQDEGLQPVTFEQHDDCGGTFYYTKHKRENQRASVYPGLLLNTSKEVSRFSDFPMPQDSPKFPTAAQFKTYLDDYAKRFGLKKHILFKTQVLKVKPVNEGRVDGDWIITYRDGEGTVHSDRFDAVVACTGSFSDPKYPQTPGLMDSYKGHVVHSHFFSDCDIIRNKRVLVIGNQHSAGDMAVLASNLAEKAVLSVNDVDTFVIPRIRRDGLALDSMVSRLESWIYPKWFLNRKIFQIVEEALDHHHYGLARGTKPYGNGTFIINDDLASRIKMGLVEVKPRVLKFTEDKAVFTDGSEESFDSVICATGYSSNYKTVDWKALEAPTRKQMKLYKWVFPLDSESPTIACIGNAQTFGSILPVFETQARWIPRVFSGKSPLPPPDTRRTYWEKRQQMYDIEFGGKPKNFPWLLLDEMSEDFGAKPSFWKLLRRNPMVAYCYLFGPVLPVQYRLVGPGAMPEAWQEAVQSYKSAIQKRT